MKEEVVARPSAQSKQGAHLNNGSDVSVSSGGTLMPPPLQLSATGAHEELQLDNYGDGNSLQFDSASPYSNPNHSSPNGSPIIQLKKKNKKPQISLPKGVNYQMQGTSLVIRVSWLIKKGYDIHQKKINDPELILFLLRKFKETGLFSWLSDQEFIEIARKKLLAVDGPIKREVEFQPIHIERGAYAILGLPPNSAEIQITKRGKGLEILIAGKFIQKSIENQRQNQFVDSLIKEMETVTGLKIKETEVFRKVSLSILEKGIGSKKAYHEVINEKICAFFFGKGAWDYFQKEEAEIEKKKQKEYQKYVSGGISFKKEVNLEDQKLFEKIQKEILHRQESKEKQKVGGRRVIDMYLIRAYRKISLHPLKDKILDRMAKAKMGDHLHYLSATDIENLINWVEVKAYEKQLGFKGKEAKNGDHKYGKVKGRIINTGGEIYKGEKATFVFKLYSWRNVLKIPNISIKWALAPADQPMEPIKTAKSYGPTNKSASSKTSFKFNDKGTYVVHAIVNHEFFEPSIFVSTPIEVVEFKERLKRQKKSAFQNMGKINKTQKEDFKTSWSNEKFGKDKYHKGLSFEGRLPKNFKRKTFEERIQFVATERKRVRELIANYKNYPGYEYTQIIQRAEKYLKTLDKRESELRSEKNEGKTFFEIKGAYASYKSKIPNGDLHLIGTARTLTMGDSQVVWVTIHDYTQLYEPEKYTFTGSGDSFRNALKVCFTKLAKSYPGGKVSVLSEALTPDGKPHPAKKTIGFELDTRTWWKDKKEKVFDPIVNWTVNILGVITMIFVPGSAAFVMPVLFLHNAAQVIDQLEQAHTKGTLTGKKVSTSLAIIALDALPILGRAKPFLNMGRRAWFSLEVAAGGGQVLLLASEAREQLQLFYDQDVARLAKLETKIQTLQKIHPGSYELELLLRKRADLIKTSQKRAKDLMKTLTIQGLLALGPTILSGSLSAKNIKKTIQDLETNGIFIHKPGAKPEYDPKTRTIIGDRDKIRPEALEKLYKQYHKDVLSDNDRISEPDSIEQSKDQSKEQAQEEASKGPKSYKRKPTKWDDPNPENPDLIKIFEATQKGKKIKGKTVEGAQARADYLKKLFWKGWRFNPRTRTWSKPNVKSRHTKHSRKKRLRSAKRFLRKNQEALLSGDPRVLQRLLDKHGDWKTLVLALNKGSTAEKVIAQNLKKYRQKIVDTLITNEGGKKRLNTIEGASNRLESDVDLSFSGSDAGKRMLRMEKQMAANYGPDWREKFRMNLYTHPQSLTRFRDASKKLNKEQRAAFGVDKTELSLTAFSEELNFAKMLIHAQGNPEAIAHVHRLMKSAGVDISDVKPWTRISKAQRAARRKELFLEIDELEKRFAKATGKDRIKLAEQISRRQMEANFLSIEAYIGPGAMVKAAKSNTGNPKALELQEQYQSMVSQMEMIQHTIHESGGDIIKAMREYEMYKYMHRFNEADFARQLTFNQKLHDKIAQVNRDGAKDWDDAVLRQIWSDFKKYSSQAIREKKVKLAASKGGDASFMSKNWYDPDLSVEEMIRMYQTSGIPKKRQLPIPRLKKKYNEGWRFDNESNKWRKPFAEKPTGSNAPQWSFKSIARRKAVARDPKKPVTDLGFDQRLVDQLGDQLGREAVERILAKSTLSEIKGQIAEELVYAKVSGQSNQLSPEDGGTIHFLRGDEISAPAPTNTSAGAQHAQFTDGMMVEILWDYNGKGKHEVNIHRIYEVKSGKASASKLQQQIIWDLERLYELGFSIKVKRPDGSFGWQYFHPDAIHAITSHRKLIHAYTPSDVRAPRNSGKWGRFTSRRIKGMSASELHNAALMVLRIKGVSPPRPKSKQLPLPLPKPQKMTPESEQQDSPFQLKRDPSTHPAFTQFAPFSLTRL